MLQVSKFGITMLGKMHAVSLFVMMMIRYKFDKNHVISGKTLQKSCRSHHILILFLTIEIYSRPDRK
jgi:hypothetical protein